MFGGSIAFAALVVCESPLDNGSNTLSAYTMTHVYMRRRKPRYVANTDSGRGILMA